MTRYPMGVEVTWLQSRPEIRFRIKNSDRGEVVFRADTPEDTGGLLLKLANGYAHLLLQFDKLRRENKVLRQSL